MDEDRRGTGRTMRQMRDAPHGAYYVTPAGAPLRYFMMLRRDLNRPDLNLIRPMTLERMGSAISAVVVDHAAELTRRERDAVAAIDARYHAAAQEHPPCATSQR